MSGLIPRWRGASGQARRLIDGHPINQGLVGFWPGADGNKAFLEDIGPRKLHAVADKDVVLASTPEGPGFSMASGGPPYSGFNALNALPTISEYTILTTIIPNFASWQGSGPWIFGRTTAASGYSPRGMSLRWNGGSDGWYVDDSAGWGSYSGNGGFMAFSAGEVHNLAFSFTTRGAAGQYYWNGRPLSTTSFGGTGSVAATASVPFMVGFNGNHIQVGTRLIERALAASEVMDHHVDTWIGTELPAERLYFFSGARGASLPPFDAASSATLIITGAVAGAVALAGASSATAAISGAAAGAVAVAGASVATLAVAGAIAGLIGLSGVSAAVLATSGAAAGAVALAGASVASLATTGAFAAGMAIAAVTTGTLTISGTIAGVGTSVAAAPAPASRTVTWSVQDRAVVWPAQTRAVIWAAQDRTVEWQE